MKKKRNGLPLENATSVSTYNIGENKYTVVSAVNREPHVYSDQTRRLCSFLSPSQDLYYCYKQLTSPAFVNCFGGTLFRNFWHYSAED
ncbi:hypothetical protein L6164_032132 [Bauhinia variegata]|uniref:Uncharacterized protein n=1 Tax=Bauhinia variegata TaxID=167791 RepID=A0ACB9KMZ9_BAUVA|nr:hypothetical protein L6164_032132 [Bauhinia variegata]